MERGHRRGGERGFTQRDGVWQGAVNEWCVEIDLVDGQRVVGNEPEDQQAVGGIFHAGGFLEHWNSEFRHGDMAAMTEILACG